METVEWSDVQGLVTSGYPKLPFAAYILWHFLSDGLVDDKGWIAELAERLMRVGDADEESNAAVDTPRSAPTATLHALKARPGRVCGRSIWPLPRAASKSSTAVPIPAFHSSLSREWPRLPTARRGSEGRIVLGISTPARPIIGIGEDGRKTAKSTASCCFLLLTNPTSGTRRR